MLSKKYSLLISCLMVLLLIMVGCGSNTEDVSSEVNENDGNQNSEDPITLKLATWHSTESHTTKEYLEPFMERVTNLTDGQVQFEFYPGEQLGKASDTLRLVESGVTDIAHFSASFATSKMSLSAIIPGIPGLYESTSQGAQAYRNIAYQSPVLEADYLDNGVRPVSTALTPFYDIFNNQKEIKVPKDIEGLKIRAAGGVFSQILDQLGTIPVQISTADIYSAYNSGVIDGIHFGASNMGSFSLGELTKYATPGLNLGSGVHGLVINEELYQGLPEDIQEVFMQVGEEMGRKITEFDEAENTRVYEEYLEAGEITLHELSEDEKAEWQNFYDEFNKFIVEEQNSEDFNKALDMFKEEIEKLQ